MMVGLRGSWRTLGLLILFSFFSLTGQFELRDDEWEALGPDIAALHRLKGLSGQMFHTKIQSSRKLRDVPVDGARAWRSSTRVEIDQNPMILSDSLQQCEDSFATCVIQQQQDLESFLAAIDDHKIHDQLLSASEISHSYSQKLLVMIDEEMATNDRVKQEYSLDPHYSVIVRKECLNNASCLPEADGYTVVKLFGKVSDDGQSFSGHSGSSLAEMIQKPSLEAVPVFSIDGNTTTDFQYNFIRVLMVRGHKAVLQTNQETHQTYQVMTDADSVYSRKIPQRPVDHTTQYDHQQIFILQDDPISRTAASYLYEKHPAVSSVYVLDNNQKPKLIKGDHVPLSENSRLTLVGHGVRDGSGETRVAEKTVSDLSEIIKQTYRVGDKIKTINLVACDVGSDKTFVETLLKDLHQTANIETELHVRDALIQVKHTGEKITQEISVDGISWRHKDESKKVVATLDKNGDVVIRQESGSRGEPVFTDERNFLGGNDRFKKYRDNWPKKPKISVDQNVVNEFENSKQISKNYVELEAMTWGLFQKDLPLPSKVQTEGRAVKGEYEIGIKVNNEIRWVSNEDKMREILSKCYEIQSGEDVRSIIRHYAKTGEDRLSYLKIGDWILAVNPDNLYVYPIGKKLGNNEKNANSKRDIRNIIKEQIGKEKYPDIRKAIVEENTGNIGTKTPKERYAEFVTDVFRGEHTRTVPVSSEAWYATYFTASVISESARNFRTFPLTLMALDMIHSGDNNIREQGLKFLFEEHSMARGRSWIDPASRGYSGTATTEGSSKYDNREPPSEADLRTALKKVIEKEMAQYESWSKRAGDDVQSKILDVAENYVLTQNDPATREAFSQDYAHFKETVKETETKTATESTSINKASGALGGSNDGHVTPRDVKIASQLEKSIKLESFYSRTKALSSEQIHNELRAKYGENLQGLQVLEGRIEDGQFICKLVSEGAEPVDFKVTLSPDSQFYNEKMKISMEAAVRDMESHSSVSIHEETSFIEHAGSAVGAVGLMLGMKGAVRAFEQGDIKDGVMGTLQTLHGVTGMTTSFIAKQTLSSEARIARAASVVMESPAMKGVMTVLPLVGIGYGIYNFEQDLERGDTLGYIDAGFDGTMVLLDEIGLVAPELEPFIMPINLVLSTVRMVFDDVFMGVQEELNSLPKDAGILEKLGAVFIGLGEGIFNFEVHVASFFYDWGYDEIREGHKIVAQISNYHQYFTVTTRDNGAGEIDFSGGAASWNGGGINFCLADQGESEFCMDYFVSDDESMQKNCWMIDTKGSNDIILGLGESHSLNYKEVTKKILMFIPVGSVKVVSGLKAIPNSRYGIYRGNSNANRFFAIQNATDRHMIEVMLSYYYTLSGEPGNDFFFLGPQRSHVQGASGKDTYIIPKKGGKTIINNYDPDKAQDTLHFSADYSHISVSKSGNDLVLMYEGSHTVMMQGWFLGDLYQHINMMSGDGVNFEISPSVISRVKLVAKGINKMFSTRGVTVDASQPYLKTVTNIIGSKHDDVLNGNGERNQIAGGGGHDVLSGGEGEDMYIINDSSQSSVVIENYSNDNKTDLAIIEANFHTFKARVQSRDLLLSAFLGHTPLSVTLRGWFISPEHRHLFIVSKDLITFTISGNEKDCMQGSRSKCIQSFRIDYSTSPSALSVDLEKDESLDSVTEVRGSKFSDTIRGNKGHNVIIPGEGTDFIQGRGGEDWYIITPGHGTKTVSNKSPDLTLDFLFLKEDYEKLSCICDGPHIMIVVDGRREVILQNWFVSKNYQHLQIKTNDGITAGLITKISSCGESVILPLTVDYSNQKPEELYPFYTQVREWLINVDVPFFIPKDVKLYIRFDREWELVKFLGGLQGKVTVNDVNSVTKMVGSSGFDIMVGNRKENILDPYTGGAIMIGGEGKDTYIIKRGYGQSTMIDNYAEDKNIDTVTVDMDFLGGSKLTMDSDGEDLILTIRTKGEQLGLRLLHYSRGFQHQHLEFLTSDGVRFRLKSLNSTGDDPLFDIEAFKVNLKTNNVDCRLDLSSQANLSAVHTVQGCSSLSNNILGNARDNALFGGWKDDALEGGEGRDTLVGGSGNDILVGCTGDDTLYGEDGNDTMMGNSGSDIFYPGPGADLVDGGPGRDTVVYKGDHDSGKGVYVNLLTGQGRFADAEGDVLKDVETVIGTIYSDILVSGYESCLLEGSDGNDILVSTQGDYLVGGNGNDIYMLAFHNGAVTINNCAKDKAKDILYLSHGLTPTFDHQLLSDGVLLTFHGQNQTSVKIFLEGWTTDGSECGHLMIVFRDLEVSVDWLLQRCNKKVVD